jgi:predicted enzyme related to lactoylglutathione lyase
MGHGDFTHIDIPVSDHARASAFYRAVLGWEPREVPGFEGYPMWQAPNGVSGGGLAPREEGFDRPRSYVEVDSIDEALRRVTALGGREVRPRTEISPTSWWAAFVDTEGNEIGLYEESGEGS